MTVKDQNADLTQTDGSDGHEFFKTNLQTSDEGIKEKTNPSQSPQSQLKGSVSPATTPKQEPDAIQQEPPIAS